MLVEVCVPVGVALDHPHLPPDKLRRQSARGCGSGIQNLMNPVGLLKRYSCVIFGVALEGWVTGIMYAIVCNVICMCSYVCSEVTKVEQGQR